MARDATRQTGAPSTEPIMLNQADVKSFFQRVEVQPSGCWHWVGEMCRGYGRMRLRLGKRSAPAHRASWVIHVGQLRPGEIIMHKCDNPRCVNPTHLEPGSHKKNMADASKRGLFRTGTGSPFSKLDEKTVAAARKRHWLGRESIASLASECGVSGTTMSRIVRGQKWKRAGGPTCEHNR